MPQVVGIRFRQAAKVYHFAPGDVPELRINDFVVVETSRGYEIGQVVVAAREVSEEEIAGQLKPVVRRATSEDLLLKEYNALREPAALERCREKVAEFNLPMKVVGAEYSFDGSSLVFFFTSEKRVDFRDLVKELARLFRARIELRQIGVRDEAKLIGGIGPCGRQLCCITHLAEFAPVSIKMAKQQDLPLSPMEISGLCGRLLCCLAYEDPYYQQARKEMPKIGEFVNSTSGLGRVRNVNVIKRTLSLELESGMVVDVPEDETGEDVRPGQVKEPPPRRESEERVTSLFEPRAREREVEAPQRPEPRREESRKEEPKAARSSEEGKKAGKSRRRSRRRKPRREMGDEREEGQPM